LNHSFEARGAFWHLPKGALFLSRNAARCYRR
jgi:hypothetical protein